jgi:hypothetical protein
LFGAAFRPAERSTRTPAKRRKDDDQSKELSAKLWDNLSQIHLTKGALKELNRRNTQAIQQKQSITTSERGRALSLRKPDPKTLTAWKTFSRHGGPDPSDLRSVRSQ